MIKNKQVIVDVSNLAYMALHSIDSNANSGGAWTTPDIESEFTKRLALSLYSTVCEHDAELTIFAMDKKKDGEYWRDSILKEWNDKHIQYFKAGDRFAQRRNGLDYFEDRTKVTKKWLKETKTELEPCKTSEIPSDTLLLMEANIDGYKGSRSRQTWAYELPRDTFAKLIGGVSNYVASVMSDRVSVARVEGFEADDIAATLALSKSRYTDTVLVTKDSDWKQICRNPVVRFFSLNSKDKELIGFEPISPEQAEADLEHKILVGDSSDTIPPCLTDDGVRITPTKIGKEGFEPSDETYERNETLIRLDFNPSLLGAIFHYQDNVWQPTPEATWNKIRISDVELERVKFNASLNGVFSSWNSGYVVPLNDA